MNNDEQNTPPPAPDPFETLAQTLANCAAMLVQCAGQIAALKKSQDATPPPPPAEQDETPPPAEEEPKPEPEAEEPKAEDQAEDAPDSPQDEPEAQPEGEDSAEEQPPAESPENAEEPDTTEEPQDEPESEPEQQDDKASDDQPTHEDGRGGEKDKPAEQEPEQTEEPAPENDEQTDSEAPGPQDEAETGDTDTEQESEQPDADDLKESDKEGTGEEQEAENAPESDAQEQPADAQPDDDNNADGTPGENADESQSAETQDSDSSQPGEMRDGNKGDDIENEDGTTQDIEPTEDDGTEAESETTNDSAEGNEDEEEEAEEDEEDGSTEAEHVKSDMELGDGSADIDSEGTTGINAGDDGRGEAATLPPDLPPLDSTLASCTAPIPPAAAPYRPLSPIAMKCADILSNSLGKRFALQRPNRHTGQLSAAAVARHAPDVFRRRPRFDGKRPKLTVIMDTSTSMRAVFLKQGTHLLDGLLEAHRRRVIDLRLYDSWRAGEAHADPYRAVDKTGLFSEIELKARTKSQYAYAEDALANAVRHGALIPDCEEEKFAAALQNLKPVILDSDATIIFTDGHWTDGSLDKVKYQCEGITVVGLYIPLEYEELRELRASLANQKVPADKRADYEKAVAEFDSTLRNWQSPAQSYCANYNARQVADSAGNGDESNRLRKEMVEIQNEWNKASFANNEAINKISLYTGRHSGIANQMRGLSQYLARSAAMLEHNSHRSYAVETAVEAAAAIAQEITRQIESK